MAASLLVLRSILQIVFFAGCIAVFDSQFLKEHECVFERKELIQYTFAPFTVSWYTCRNVYPSKVDQVTCEKRCAHPLFPKRPLSRRLRPMPMYQCRSVEVRRGGVFVTEKMAIPYACNCVLLSGYLSQPERPVC